MSIVTNRSLFSSDFSSFYQADKDTILGEMISIYHGSLLSTSTNAFEQEILIMKEIVKDFISEEGKIIFEYNIPRLGKRIDVVLLLKGIIFCLEFKAGKVDEQGTDVDQVFDYALDLANFHKLSLDRIIVPILIPTEYSSYSNDVIKSAYSDNVVNPLVTGKEYLLDVIYNVINHYPHEKPIDEQWEISPYSPTPTIIEAARALYENHSVEDITRHEADQVSTDRTIKYIMDVIQDSKINHKKSICFVTGVPGAGKTLVGLEVAIRQTYQGNNEPVKDEGAVYLSGNSPLIAVLTEALAQDNFHKCKEKKIDKKLTDCRREVSKSIQIIHRYRDNMLMKIKNPVIDGALEIDPNKAIKNKESGYGEVEHVAIFDEAQRSWTHKRLSDYLKRGGTYGNKLKVPNFPVSEANFLIWSLDQREDWATIVCLVGGGQEINTGEAGIKEWISALNDDFPEWFVHISPQLTDKEYAEGKVKELLQNNPKVVYADDLHLSVSLRSFRAEKLAKFVHHLLDCENDLARPIYNEIVSKYPLYITRDIEKARKWLRKNTRGNERSGLLVSKESARYKPLAVHVLSNDENSTIHWFLDDRLDTRSSNYLEDAVTEIQVQGLELDYTCLLWDADLRYVNGCWEYYKFNNNTQKWTKQNPNDPSKIDVIKYMLNAYRVLLTRARKGMIICVPRGNDNIGPNGHYEDPTRLPSFYDSTYEYLKSCGIKDIDD